MFAKAGMCNHKCHKGQFTVVTDFVFEYNAFREMNTNGGLDSKFDTMISDFADAISK